MPTTLELENPVAHRALMDEINRALSEAARDGVAPTQRERVELLQRLLGKSICRSLGIYPLPEGFLLTVVVPVYNEAATVEDLIRRVQDVPIPKEIVVVDDCSTDGTAAILDRLARAGEVVLLRQERNQGKGAALKRGFLAAQGDVVVVQDADLEYDPGEFPRLIQPIVEGEADVVFGSRFLGGNHRVLYFWHYLGNQFLTTASNAFTNLNLTDMETCYKVFRREVIQQIAPKLEETRFGIEPEITARVARIPGVRIFERPVSYSGRTYEQGKKIGWRDGFRALWCILKYR
mgnify:CR=1 FL=1